MATRSHITDTCTTFCQFLKLNNDIMRHNKLAKRVTKVRKSAKIRNRYNQVPHLTQDTNGKVTHSQLDITNEC